MAQEVKNFAKLARQNGWLLIGISGYVVLAIILFYLID